MSDPQWTAVDRYFDAHLIGADAALAAALAASESAGLPAISVAANMGKLLMMVARMVGARRILEIGTLGGYSTIWMARALPADGRLITLEIEPRNAGVARANVAAAGLSAIVDIRLGPALATLPTLAGDGPFDLIFIDADKSNNTAYLDWALKLSRPGSAIVIDNVVRGGAVANAKSRDASVIGARRVTEAIAAEPRLTATALQTVGVKGYDGFILALVGG
jgi:predicted O-methyltransferase YrrM